MKNCGKAGDILGQVEAVFQKREKQDRKKAKMYTNMQKIRFFYHFWKRLFQPFVGLNGIGFKAPNIIFWVAIHTKEKSKENINPMKTQNRFYVVK